MRKHFLLLTVALLVLCAGCTSNGSSIDLAPNIREPAPRAVTCHLCHGDGICYHCDGEGFRNGYRCSVCNGTGNCDVCSGMGSIEVLELDGKDYTVCTSCHGDGSCGVCNGTGRIVQQYSTLGRVDSDCRLCHGSGKCLGCHGTGLKELRGF